MGLYTFALVLTAGAVLMAYLIIQFQCLNTKEQELTTLKVTNLIVEELYWYFLNNKSNDGLPVR